MRLFPRLEQLSKYTELDVGSIGRSAIACAAGGAGLLGESIGGALPAALGALGGAALGASFEIGRQLERNEHQSAEAPRQQG